MINFSLKNRIRITTAVLQRESKSRFGNKLTGAFWIFFEPAVQIIIFGSLFYFRDISGPYNSNIFAFISISVIIFLNFSKTFSRCMGALDSNKTLLSYPILKPIDTLIARAILEAIIYSFILIIFIFIALYYNLIETIEKPMFLILSMINSTILGFSLGTITASISSFYKPISNFIAPINRLLFLSSGIFFCASMLPQFAQEILLWNPVFHMTEMARYSIIDGFNNEFLNLRYVIIIQYIFVVLAASSLSIAEKSTVSNIRGNQ